MEFIKIGYDSVKISLCREEAIDLKLTEEADMDSEEIRESLSKLLAGAKERVGFQYAGERIVAEMFTSKNGGCDLFISKVGKSTSREQRGGKVEKRRAEVSVFSFDKLDELLYALRRLRDLKYIGKSSLYYGDDTRKYYILLENVSIKDIKYAFLPKADSFSSGIAHSFLLEHCRCICKKNAVGVLSAVK